MGISLGSKRFPERSKTLKVGDRVCFNETQRIAARSPPPRRDTSLSNGTMVIKVTRATVT
jgi:hypothetical protein